jgi:hypothetical protein
MSAGELTAKEIKLRIEIEGLAAKVYGAIINETDS